MYLGIVIIIIILGGAIVWAIKEKRDQDNNLIYLQKEVATTESVYRNVSELPQETGDIVLLIVNNKVVQGYRASIGDVDLFYDECGSLIEEDIELLKTIERNVVFAAFIK